MKVAYLGPYKDASGYGEAARGYIQALHHQGNYIDLYPIRFDNANFPDSAVIKEIDTYSLDEYDILIQHLAAPQLNKYVPPKLQGIPYKIAITTHETDRFPKDWVDAIAQSDGIIVPSYQNMVSLKQWAIKPPVTVVPHCFNAEKYEKKYPKLELKDVNEDTVKFYSIFQHTPKKGLDQLVQAYYLAFQDCPDEVTLILRVYINSEYTPTDTAKITQFINYFKQLIPLKKYPPIALISHHLNDKEVCSLHQHNDIFVTASKGEGWCIPAFDAMGFGSTPIAAPWGGMAHYIDSLVGFPLDYELVPCISMFTTRENWAQPLLSSLITQMQRAKFDFEHGKLDKKKSRARHRAQQYKIENSEITFKIKNLINGKYSNNN
jgi:hypothetical protein